MRNSDIFELIYYFLKIFWDEVQQPKVAQQLFEIEHSQSMISVLMYKSVNKIDALNYCIFRNLISQNEVRLFFNFFLKFIKIQSSYWFVSNNNDKKNDSKRIIVRCSIQYFMIENRRVYESEIFLFHEKSMLLIFSLCIFITSQKYLSVSSKANIRRFQTQIYISIFMYIIQAL